MQVKIFAVSRFIILAALLLLVLVACGTSQASEPTPRSVGQWANPELGQRLEKIGGTSTPIPTPYIEATATAAVQSALDNQRTGTPLSMAEISSTGEPPPLPPAAPATAKTSSPPASGTLLENINTAMAEVTSVYTEAKLVVRPNKESDEELVSIHLEGEIETDPDGDGQIVFTVAINRSVFAGSFSGE